MCESDGGKSADGVLLDNSLDIVLNGLQTMNESFSFRVARHCHGKIGISRESRFSARGHGEPANQREGGVGFSKIRVNLTKRRFERGHASLVSGSTGRPEQSPDSAPGRCASHS
jgi:hypothetical protein